MNKGHKGAVFATGLIIGVAISIIFLVWAFPGFRNPTYQQERYYNAHNDQNGEYNPVIRPSFWETYTTPTDTYAQWIMAALSVVATGVSAWAVWLVRDTLKLNQNAVDVAVKAMGVQERTFEIEFRPILVPDWVTIEPFGIGHKLGQFTDLARMKWVNIGKTPAKMISTAVYVSHKGTNLVSEAGEVDMIISTDPIKTVNNFDRLILAGENITSPAAMISMSDPALDIKRVNKFSWRSNSVVVVAVAKYTFAFEGHQGEFLVRSGATFNLRLDGDGNFVDYNVLTISPALLLK
ncbi:hypothetical protein P3C58_22645 [Mesorhizobium sp. XAP10]|uniref:hypothetical protein n=1 Tax=unclassified Mesorhizobium TaxID=325217 RepID=UPI0023DFFA47|nr:MULTISPECIES: hypothetical protein [unclassified Mesorhizobium]MDF3154782.1 hypothetical protein [Mesorhizobium sp. XAP10]MDF3247668.1 hypothetical protein [Mesorhizobium sp. XAP4]